MVFHFNFFDRMPLKNEKQKVFEILGIINGPIRERKFNTGSIRQRIPIILPDFSQCLVELWTPQNFDTPQFFKNWKKLQLILIAGLHFAGYAKINDTVVRVLRLPMYKVKSRLVWLSAPNFWHFPVSMGPTVSKACAGLNWPEAFQPSINGFLNSSKGSIKTGVWANLYPKIHSNSLEPYNFEDILLFHTRVEKSAVRFVDMASKKQTNADLIFER